jgi:hypothetical protein
LSSTHPARYALTHIKIASHALRPSVSLVRVETLLKMQLATPVQLASRIVLHAIPIIVPLVKLGTTLTTELASNANTSSSAVPPAILPTAPPASMPTFWKTTLAISAVLLDSPTALHVTQRNAFHAAQQLSSKT